MDIEQLVKRAISGNKEALGDVVQAIQDDIYYLSLRMLAQHDLALDVTQDILIKVITNLASFRFESQFKTWVYRIAVNFLITEKSVIAKDPNLSFELFSADLESDIEQANTTVENYSPPEYQILLNELRISCTIAMLLCLNRSHRMAYILGDILEFEHNEGGEILGITRDNFRQQLSRARAKVTAFTNKRCGQVTPSAKCACDKKISGAIKKKRVNPADIIFSTSQQFSYDTLQANLHETKQALRTIGLQKSIRQYKCPSKLAQDLDDLVRQGID